MTYPSDPRDYSKEAQRGRMSNLSFQRAVDLCRQGWLIAREGWAGKNTYVKFATGGKFYGKDNSSGALTPFYVMRIGRDMYVPWIAPVEDTLAEDWLAITAQEESRASEAVAALEDTTPDPDYNERDGA